MLLISDPNPAAHWNHLGSPTSDQINQTLVEKNPGIGFLKKVHNVLPDGRCPCECGNVALLLGVLKELNPDVVLRSVFLSDLGYNDSISQW